MKNLLTYLFLAVLLVSMGSCSKNDDPKIDEDDLLIGTWEAERYKESNYMNETLDAAFDVDKTSPEWDEVGDMTFSFSVDNRVTFIFRDGDNGEMNTATFPYTVPNENRLIIHTEGELFYNDEFEILQLSRDNLVLRNDSGNEEESDGNWYRDVAEIYFKRKN